MYLKYAKFSFRVEMQNGTRKKVSRVINTEAASKRIKFLINMCDGPLLYIRLSMVKCHLVPIVNIVLYFICLYSVL